MLKQVKTLAVAVLCLGIVSGQEIRSLGGGGGGQGFVYTGILATIPATCTVGQIAFITNAAAGQNIYECAATNVWTQQLNSGAGGASMALDNLAAVAINTALVPTSAGTIDLGTTAKPFRNLIFGASATNNTKLASAVTTAQRTVTTPDADSVTGIPKVAATHKFFSALTAGGVLTDTQPACADISDASNVCTVTLGTGVGTFLTTPTSANLASAVTNETGTGLLVFGTGPVIDLTNGTGLPAASVVAGTLGTGNYTVTGNFTATGSISSGSGSGVGGALDVAQGTLPSIVANTVSIVAPTSVTGYEIVLPGTAATGFRLLTNAANVVTETIVGSSGSGNVCLVTSCTMATPALGTPASGVMTNLTGLPIAATPLTTRGDILVVNSTPALARLAKGTQYQTLQGGASDTLFDAVHLDQSTAVTGVLPTANIAVALANQTSLRGNSMAAAAGDATIGQVIAHGAKALATGSISSAACTTAQTDTATGTATTDAIVATFNGDPTGVTGYVPLTAGMLTIIAYPTADTVNFKVCNNTTSSITPGAITLNWRVVR